MTKLKVIPWWQNVQTIVSILIGLGAMSSWVISSFVADAKQQGKIEQVEVKVVELKQSDEQQEDQIDDAKQNYMLIQQSLGGIQETLKELKEKRR